MTIQTTEAHRHTDTLIMNEKHNKTFKFQLRIEPMLFERFARVAGKENRSVSAVIRELMWDYLDENEE